MIPERATKLDPAGVAAIPAPTSSTPPPPPPPPAGYPRPPAPRRRGIVVIPESDVARLVKLGPGQQIIGLRVDEMRSAFLVLVTGDDLPIVNEYTEPPTLHGFRYATPPPGQLTLVDWPAMTPLELHALVRLSLEPIEGVEQPPGTPWAALAAIVARHAPYEMSGRWWCSWCCGDCHAGEHAHWPCGDYVDAATPIVRGLEVADHA